MLVMRPCMLFFLNAACHLDPLAVCSLDPSVIMTSGALCSRMNLLSASPQSLFFSMGCASQNIFLFPNTWQCLHPCIPLHLGSIMSDAISPMILLGSCMRSVLHLLDNGMIADLTWFWMVASKVNLACPTDAPQASLESSGIMGDGRR